MQDSSDNKSRPSPGKEEPALLQASTFSEQDIGTPEWNSEHNADLLRISNDGKTIEWDPHLTGSGKYRPAFVPASTRLHLHSGHFRWDFEVNEMAVRQIGVGFMLLWNVGPDWGFFGYLGASPSAWSYDPSTGDVVCSTESIEGGLPTFEDGHTGTVSVDLRLPRDAEGEARFVVAGVQAKPISLPAGSVVLPAACFLESAQKVTFAHFERR